MTVVVDLSIPPRSFPFGRVIHGGGAGSAEVVVTQVVPRDGAVIPYFWVSGAEPDAFESRLRVDANVEHLRRLDGVPERTLFRLEMSTADATLLGALDEGEVSVESMGGDGERWDVRISGDDYVAVTAFFETLRERGIGFSVRRVSNGPSRGGIGYRLTEKQYEVLELAYREGYFDVPRGTTLTELGDRLDISDSAVAQRLRRGLTALLSETVFGPADSFRFEE